MTRSRTAFPPLVPAVDHPKRELAERAFDVRQFPFLFRPSDPDVRDAALGGRDWLPNRQLKYIAQYLKGLGCVRMVLETHYIDRDFMEDFSSYYSRSFLGYSNSCRRLHFFRVPPDGAQLPASILAEMDALRDPALSESDEGKNRKSTLQMAYLGTMVVRPLPQCPVGRTTLQDPTASAEPDGYARQFNRPRVSTFHLGGLTFTIRAIPFQQQDQGTSACATTALWCAMHNVKEDRAASSPAEITRFATRFSIPHGRPLPSTGLAITQMCEAVRAAGLAPYLYKHVDLETSKDLLHLAVASDLPAVAIVRRAESIQRDRLHAVAIVGGEYALPTFDEGAPAICSPTSDLLARLRVHDDRLGPYVALDIVRDHEDAHDETRRIAKRECERKRERFEQDPRRDRELTRIERRIAELDEARFFSEDDCVLRLTSIMDGETTVEYLVLTHILLPLHQKIRLSSHHLQKRAVDAATELYGMLGGGTVVWYEPRIMLGTEYLSELLKHEALSQRQRKELTENLALSRYVGLVRIGVRLNVGGNARVVDYDVADMVLDTTGTELHAAVLALVQLAPGPHGTSKLHGLVKVFPDAKCI